MYFNPASTRSLMNSAFLAVGIVFASFCSPSLGPTSTILTLFGRSAMLEIVHNQPIAIYSASMQRRAFHASLILFFLSALVPLFAQEGHPLTGTWSGDWGPTPTQRNHVTLVMSWDGK